MSTESNAKIRIESEYYTPEEINSLVGISCDKLWKIGELRYGRTTKSKSNGWVLYSGLEKSKPLDLHLKSLLKKTSSHLKEYKALSKKSTIEVLCVIYSRDGVPPLNFNEETINLISELGASLDIDLYVLGDDSDSTE